MAGVPRAARVRPSSRAKSGFPSVASNSRRRTCREQAQPEAIGQHPTGRAEAERADLETPRPSPRERLHQDGGTPGTLGEQKPDRLVLEPPHGERQRLGRRRIQPLDVVDGNQQRPPHRQRPQRVEEAERDRSGLRRNIGRLGTQERNLQRTQLRRRQPSQLLRAHTVEQIDQRREREPRLGLARAGGKHTQPSPARRSQPRLPQRRLPDTRPAAENERQLGRVGPDELEQDAELTLTADDRRIGLPDLGNISHLIALFTSWITRRLAGRNTPNAFEERRRRKESPSKHGARGREAPARRQLVIYLASGRTKNASAR